MALEAAWEERFGHRLEVYVSNDCLMLLLPHDVRSEEILSLVTSANVLALLKKRLEGSGFFGARFRECAGRALQLMELSGEVLTGYFFRGVPGPQFISHEAFRMLQRKMPEDKVYWISATDPASLCGIQLGELKGTLPRRIAGNHLVYRGNKMVLESRRYGRTLSFHSPQEDHQLPVYLEFLHHLLTRRFQPMRRIVVESINGEDAARSPYVDALRTSFEVIVNFRNVILYRKEV